MWFLWIWWRCRQTFSDLCGWHDNTMYSIEFHESFQISIHRTHDVIIIFITYLHTAQLWSVGVGARGVTHGHVRSEWKVVAPWPLHTYLLPLYATLYHLPMEVCLQLSSACWAYKGNEKSPFDRKTNWLWSCPQWCKTPILKCATRQRFTQFFQNKA